MSIFFRMKWSKAIIHPPLMEQNPLILNLFADLIAVEAHRLGVPIQPIDVAEACYEKLFEVIQQEAYEVVLDIQEARDSLPPWENPTGDVPEISELAGSCR